MNSDLDLDIEAEIRSMIDQAKRRNDFLFEQCILISRILDRIVSERAVDQACSTLDEISAGAADILDRAHLSAAIHAFFVSHIFHISLPATPAYTLHVLQDLGAYHWNALTPSNTLKDRDTGRKPEKKVYLLQIFKKSLYRILNWVVLNVIPRKSGAVCYGYLYNLEMPFNFKFLFASLFHSIRGHLVRIDLEKYTIKDTAASTKLSSEVRTKLCHVVIESLGRVSGIDGIDIADLAKYIAQSVPVSHLENREENFEWATANVQTLKPRTFVSTMAIMYEGSYVFLAAAGRQHFKSTVVGIQHGGSYGYFRGHNHVYNCEYRTLDYFISWGWDKTHSSFGSIKAKILPLGSHYLRRLAGEPKRPKPAGTTTRILLVPGNFFERDSRCDQNFDKDFYINTVFPLNAAVLVNLAKSLNASVDFKGGYPTSLEPQYFKILKAHCDRNGIVLNDIGTAGSVCTLFDNYDLVLFEVIGTSSWEALAKKTIFLFLPSAKIAAIDHADELSESLYAHHHMQGKTVSQITKAFHHAVTESRPFLGRYGKQADHNLWQLLVTPPDQNLSS